MSGGLLHRTALVRLTVVAVFGPAALIALAHIPGAERPQFVSEASPQVPTSPPAPLTITGPVSAGPSLSAADRTGTVETQPAPTSSWVMPPPVPSGLWGLPFAPDGLDDCGTAEWYRVQWQLPDQFARITWRESRCINREDVRTSCCVSRYQLYVRLHLRNAELALRYEACEVFDEFDIDGPQPIEQQRAACATKALFDIAGMSPWAMSS